MKDYRELRVWHHAHALTLTSYRATKKFPREELFGLTSQIRRCAASVAANIAEGCGRTGNAELNRFLQISSGSASELDYHFLLAKDLGYLKPEDYEELATELSHLRRMLSALIVKISEDVAGTKTKAAAAKG
jgi:four helix bundle protein